MSHEKHPKDRATWLRAAVLGANDGVVSVASLLSGMIASAATQGQILVTGSAGILAGALSMAAGEYVSVASQADAEAANVRREQEEQRSAPDAERRELTEIYVRRGLDETLAAQVAEQLMAHDALGSHLRDELGILEATRARPLLAAAVSAISFVTGALWPLAVATWSTGPWTLAYLVGSAVALLVVTGAGAARLGGAAPLRAAIRVAGWGAAAMALTALVGRWVGTRLGP